jgi:septum formation protein
MALILASSSPRRSQLLALGGWEFETRPAEIDESPLPAEDPREYVLRLALGKAQAIAASAGAEALVIAADTTVALDGAILGKPADDAEAEAMLRSLRGRTHQVHTALVVRRAPDEQVVSDVCTTDVLMRPYDDEEMRAYIASGDPLDKAGAYAIQHAGFHPVESLTGCYTNVMGLPVCTLANMLADFGISPRAEIGRRCLDELGYRCPVFSPHESGEVSRYEMDPLD